MPPHPKSEEKRRHILLAVRQVLAQKGYYHTTISEIAQAAGVSRGLLHYYFANKEEMLAQAAAENNELGTQTAIQVLDRIQSGQELAQAMAHGLRAFLRQDPDFCHIFFEGWALTKYSKIVHQKFKELYDYFQGAIRDALERAVSRKALGADLNLDGLAPLITVILEGFSLQVMKDPDMLEDEALWSGLENCLERLLT